MLPDSALPLESGPAKTEAAPPPIDSAIATALTDNRRDFLRFLVRRVRDVDTAEEVLQNFCIRAIRRNADLKNSESVMAWLYALLRSALADHFRSEAARRRRESDYMEMQTLLEEESQGESERRLCACFHRVLPTIRADYAEILRRVDLREEPREKVAEALEITATNARVRLHRARQALRQALESTCGSDCCRGAVDCTCDHAPAEGEPFGQSHASLS